MDIPVSVLLFIFLKKLLLKEHLFLIASTPHHLSEKQCIFPENSPLQKPVLLSSLKELWGRVYSYQPSGQCPLFNIFLGCVLLGVLLDPIKRLLFSFAACTSPFIVLLCSWISYLSSVGILPVL